MTKNKTGIITVIAIAGIALAAWHLTHQNSKAYAKQIIKLGGADGYSKLLTFDQDFLKAWSKAISKGKGDFSYKNETYRTQGGTKIV